MIHLWLSPESCLGFGRSFRERGAVETEVDPDDGRRTLVRLHPDFLRSMAERRAVPVEEALSEALDISDARVLAEIVATLELLAGRVRGAEGSEARRTGPRPGRATGPRGSQVDRRTPAEKRDEQ